MSLLCRFHLRHQATSQPQTLNECSRTQQDPKFADRAPERKLWNVGRGAPLLRLDARELDYLGPFLGFGCYICTELHGGEDHRDRAEVGEPRPDGWVC